MIVKIHGPNLSDQGKGAFHAHAATCTDNAHYGPGKKYGGEDLGWMIEGEALTRRDIVEAIYGDFEDYTDANWRDFDVDIWIAPCLKMEDDNGN